MEQVINRKKPAMERKKTMTMNWYGLGDDEDDDHFFETSNRLSSVVPIDLLSSGSEDEDEFEDSRLSFSSAVSSASFKIPTTTISDHNDFIVPAPLPMFGDYDMWMSEPGNIQERRKRLLHGMGLCSNKNLLKSVSTKLAHAVSKKINHSHVIVNDVVKPPITHPVKPQVKPSIEVNNKPNPTTAEKLPPIAPIAPILLVRSRSDGDIEAHSVHTRRRKEEILGTVSKQRLTRTSSLLITPKIVVSTHVAGSVIRSPKNRENRGNRGSRSSVSGGGDSIDLAAFFLIKNLDTGKEFVVKEYNEDGLWNRFSDIQTGKQLTMEEFEKSVGYSPVVKELMRRQNVAVDMDDPRKIGGSSYFSKSIRYSKRRGVSLLKNIKGTMGSSKFNELPPSSSSSNSNSNSNLDEHHSNKNSNWVKVRSQGKSLKEFTALHICQEIQAHEGSIWTIKFSLDGHYLASAGEDRVINVWEVQECEVMLSKSFDESGSVGGGSSVHSCTESERKKDRPHLAELSPMPSEKRKKWKKKGNSIPDYVHVPENMFSLSDKPVCTFTGHLDDVLDLSWSKSQLLLSSSMDKTVRLWDLETKNCLKTFAHNDYVTCIQFNPIDDDYFISGSLDEKVRIWSIPDRKLVDYADLHEMVTAVRYTPDSQGAMIGTHKGGCRLYTITDCSLEQTSQIELSRKKKPQSKKITGFEFAPDNPRELLITSADSRIRIANASDISQKFKGFKNTSSQISASFSHDGKYVISASEDSQVYIWRRGSGGKGKGLVTINATERFPCKDISVAIPWPGSERHETPMVNIHSKRHSRKSISQPLSNSPKRDDYSTNAHSKRELPPLPRKSISPHERSSSCQEDQLADPSQICRSNSGMGESFSSISSSCRFGESPSISRSLEGVSNGHHTIQATAWGLVIVTASLGGEIRAYQNIGLPRKVGRQTNLFRDPT